VGFEQIPEQQQRPKVALEMASGRPSFDVVNVAMHVQKRLIEKARWMKDLRPYIAAPSLTAPDFDQADFSKPSMAVAAGEDGRQMLAYGVTSKWRKVDKMRGQNAAPDDVELEYVDIGGMGRENLLEQSETLAR